LSPTEATPPSSLTSSWRRLPRNVWVVTATSFLTDVSSEMVVYLVPLFLAEVLGVRTGVIGLIEGSAETTASLLKAVSGWISDRLGRRKWLTVAGYGISTLAKPFLYLANAWGWVLGVRLADRVGKGIRTAPRDALIADSVAAPQRGVAFGLHRAGDTAGAALGLTIALAIVWLMQGSGLELDRATFQTVVLVSLVPAVLAVIVLAFGARDVTTTATEPRPALRLALAGLDVRFRGFLFVIVLFTLGNSSDAFLILRARDRGVGLLGVMAMLIAFNLVYAAVSGPAGDFSDRVGRRRIILGGWLAYGLIYLGFANAAAAWQVVALFITYGVYYGLTEGAAKAMVADLVPPERRGTAYGVFNAAIGLTALPASLLAGLAWQGIGTWPGFGAAAPFWIGAALALLAVLLFAFWWPTLGRKTEVV
jgi:MFS family permease